MPIDVIPRMVIEDEAPIDHKAVEAFQARYAGVTVDGKVGAQTWAVVEHLEAQLRWLKARLADEAVNMTTLMDSIR